MLRRPPLATVAVEGGDADQGRDLAPVDLAQFGQLGEQDARDLRSDAGHALQELVLCPQVGTVLDAGLELVLDSLAFLREPGDVRLDPGSQGGGGGAAALALGDQHRDQLSTSGEQLTQMLGLGIGQRAQLQRDGLSEVGQDGGVERVGLGQPAGGAGEVANLARVDHHHRQPRRGQLRDQRPLQTAGRLQHDSCRCQRLQLTDQGVDPGRVVVHPLGGSVSRPDGEIQPLL